MQIAWSHKQKHYPAKQDYSPPAVATGLTLAFGTITSVSSSLLIESKEPAGLPALFSTIANIFYGTGGDNRSLLLILGLLLLMFTGLLLTIQREEPDWRYLSSLTLRLSPRGEYIPRSAPETNDSNTDSLYLLHYPHNRGSPAAG